MPKFRRLVLVLLSILIGYAAAYAGDGVGVINPKPFAHDYDVVDVSRWVAGIVLVLGIAMFSGAIVQLTKPNTGRGMEVWLATGAFVCFSYFFGYLATPFRDYGPWPWTWISRSVVIPAIGFVPVMFIFESALTDWWKVVVSWQKWPWNKPQPPAE